MSPPSKNLTKPKPVRPDPSLRNTFSALSDTWQGVNTMLGDSLGTLKVPAGSFMHFEDGALPDELPGLSRDSSLNQSGDQ